MGLYNFKRRFAPFILSGAKRHTIRAHRKNPDVVGNVMHLYTGLRTKNTKLLGRFPCVRIEEITISRRTVWRFDVVVVVNGVHLDAGESAKLWPVRMGLLTFERWSSFGRDGCPSPAKSSTGSQL